MEKKLRPYIYNDGVIISESFQRLCWDRAMSIYLKDFCEADRRRESLEEGGWKITDSERKNESIEFSLKTNVHADTVIVDYTFMVEGKRQIIEKRHG